MNHSAMRTKSSGDERRCAVCSLQVGRRDSARPQAPNQSKRIKVKLIARHAGTGMASPPASFPGGIIKHSRPTGNALITSDAARDLESTPSSRDLFDQDSSHSHWKILLLWSAVPLLYT